MIVYDLFTKNSSRKDLRLMDQKNLRLSKASGLSYCYHQEDPPGSWVQ